MIPQAIKENKNISNIWKYDQTSGSSTFCITGEESTCLPINPEVFEPGTIIKYKVNDTEEKYFHVVFDEGDTLTLQQRENTVKATNWYASRDSTKGPLTILTALENATSGWTNVLNQTYTLGTTVFKDNAYTGCTSDSCTTNIYSLPARTAKARLISVQEINKIKTSSSVPMWMYNYLNDSINQGGTVNGTDFGYWTSSAYSSNSTGAWYVNTLSRMNAGATNLANVGARMVILVKK